jgi:N-acetylneuraminic acid mutarotase
MDFMKHILKRMRLILSTVIVFSIVVTLFSCGSSSDDPTDGTPKGDWTIGNDFDGVVRSGAVSFTIDNTPYIGFGVNSGAGSGTNQKFLSDLYKYDVSLNTWTKIESAAPFPGVARSHPIAFVINGKAYIGLGFDGLNYLKDFYEFNPADNSWTTLSDFDGSARYGSVAFAIGEKGYVGAGIESGSNLKDFWEYTPGTDTWTQKAAIGGSKRAHAFSFVVADKGYVGGGFDNNLNVITFFEYDPIQNIWTEKNNLEDENTDTDTNDKGYSISREQAVTFVINGLAYVTTGARNSSLDLETWEYNPSTDTWKEKTPFSGPSRQNGVGFVIGNLGYVATGRAGGSYFDDIWSFDPTAVHK